VSSANEDWFKIEINRDSENSTVSIDRVIFWSLMEVEGQIEHLDAICSAGTPMAALGENHLAFTDYFFVHGRDKCPTGETWLEIYEKTLPTGMNYRDITHLYKEFL
jgi:hypothetical protein